MRCFKMHKNEKFSSRHAGAIDRPRIFRAREKKRFHCDVSGGLWTRLEQDGGVQGEAGHASSGRLCFV